MFLSRCRRRLAAFFSNVSKSSGVVGANPASFSIFVIVFPVIGLVNGTLCRSRSIVPISLAGCPSLASLTTIASTSSGLYLHHDGDLLVTGRIEWDFPFSCFGISYHHLNS